MRRTTLILALAVGGCGGTGDATPNAPPSGSHAPLPDAFVPVALLSAPSAGFRLQLTVTGTPLSSPLGGELGLFRGLTAGLTHLRLVPTATAIELHQDDGAGGPDTTLLSWPASPVTASSEEKDGATIVFAAEPSSDASAPWRKVSFGAAQMSELSLLGRAILDPLARCADVETAQQSLVPASFHLESQRGYLSWRTSIVLPLRHEDSACDGAFAAIVGDAPVPDQLQIEITVSLAPAATSAYRPLVLGDSDPIRHKYGFGAASREGAASSLTARFDGTKDIDFRFAPGFPETRKSVFRDAAAGATAAFAEAGLTTAVRILETTDDLQGGPPHALGDARDNIIVWDNDDATAAEQALVVQRSTDPLTGEVLAASVRIHEGALAAKATARSIAYLRMLGGCDGSLCDPADASADETASWPVGACSPGEARPLVDPAVSRAHGGASPLYRHLQADLGAPIETSGPLGPIDLVSQTASDEQATLAGLLPYLVFADPDRTLPGAESPADAIWSARLDALSLRPLSHQIAAGAPPFTLSSTGNRPAIETKVASVRAIFEAQRAAALVRARPRQLTYREDASAFPLEAAIAGDARRCTAAGTWETKQEWVASLVDTSLRIAAWHAMGHALGLDDNFFGSLDLAHFPADSSLASSTVMEHRASPSRAWTGAWGDYDRAALAFLYANDAQTGDAPGASISGQVSAAAPWLDPLGFAADGRETSFLRCDATDIAYTPYCRAGDAGTTLGEIVAHDIEDIEWSYQAARAGVDRASWLSGARDERVVRSLLDTRRFFVPRAVDLAPGELADTFRRLALGSSDQAAALAASLSLDADAAVRLAAALHRATLELTDDERPFFPAGSDPGSALDKLAASHAALVHAVCAGPCPTTTIDDAPIDDTTVLAMSGDFEGPSGVRGLSVASGEVVAHAVGTSVTEATWLGGYLFTTESDYLQLFRTLAVDNDLPGCANVDDCPYVPSLDLSSRVVAPDGHTWVVHQDTDRNIYVIAREDLHRATARLLERASIASKDPTDDRGVGDLLDYGVLLTWEYKK